ncbi:hypothetical protein HYALB_00013964 [Hymenoscyphus albidus]|uniref:S-adenosyl-L-methionine-dependent methyltransferase n=1 Tax=Hymenoscyphus albidus TaxID=595503 RepID=A0A9N9QB94_9HELO|nr:hypothetical protein HYALB_00013964 [Hymenoscyphus albidus]
MSLHGRLHLAPLKEESLQHALDFGTGTGIWAMEFAQKYPNCKVIGNDLSPIQPEFVTQNLEFEVDDVEDEWVYAHKFDFIHGRLMAFALTSPLTLFHRAFTSLSPGGYFEMQDPAPPIRAFDSTLTPSPALLRTAVLLLTATQKAGIDITAPSRYASMMAEVGFVDVKEVVINWPVGTLAKGEYHKKLGAWFRRDMEVGVEGILMGLFTRVLGMGRDEVGVLVEELKGEMRDDGLHAFQPL